MKTFKQILNEAYRWEVFKMTFGELINVAEDIGLKSSRSIKQDIWSIQHKTLDRPVMFEDRKYGGGGVYMEWMPMSEYGIGGNKRATDVLDTPGYCTLSRHGGGAGDEELMDLAFELIKMKGISIVNVSGDDHFSRNYSPDRNLEAVKKLDAEYREMRPE